MQWTLSSVTNTPMSSECQRSSGFAPLANADARVLILGSLPSQRSIASDQYYAHPQNAFWRIMAVLFGANGDYDNRCLALQEGGVAGTSWQVRFDPAAWTLIFKYPLLKLTISSDFLLSTARSNEFVSTGRKPQSYLPIRYHWKSLIIALRRLACRPPARLTQRCVSSVNSNFGEKELILHGMVRY